MQGEFIISYSKIIVKNIQLHDVFAENNEAASLRDAAYDYV